MRIGAQLSELYSLKMLPITQGVDCIDMSTPAALATSEGNEQAITLSCPVGYGRLCSWEWPINYERVELRGWGMGR